MDNLYSGLHGVVDHADHAEIDFGGGATRVRPLPQKTVAASTPAGTGWYHDAAIEADRKATVEARCNPYHR